MGNRGGILEGMPRQIAQDRRPTPSWARDPALLCGMLLDQQVPMEVAFAGPAKILETVRHLDPAAIRCGRRGRVRRAVCAAPGGPPLPRVDGGAGAVPRRRRGAGGMPATPPGSGRRLATALDLVRRLEALPGFRAAKAKIFGALVGKQLGPQPAGWERRPPVWRARRVPVRGGCRRRRVAAQGAGDEEAAKGRRPRLMELVGKRAAGLRDLRRGGGGPCGCAVDLVVWRRGGPPGVDLRPVLPPVPAQHRGPARAGVVVARGGLC